MPATAHLGPHIKPNFSLDTPVADVMTRSPRTIAPDALIAEALDSISHKISALLVVERAAVRGIVHFHDLVRIGAFCRATRGARPTPSFQPVGQPNSGW